AFRLACRLREPHCRGDREMAQGDPGSQHQGGVTPSLGPHSITSRYANRTTGRSEAMSHSVARRCWSLFSATRRDVAFAHADSLNRKRNAADKREGANLGGTPCWQKSSCSDWKRQRERPRKRPTARGLSRSHCRLRRRPRSQPNSKENAPTRHARATGRDLSSTPRWSAGADDQLTNAGTRRPVRCRRYTESKRSPGRAGASKVREG